MNCYVLFKKSANPSILVSTDTCLAPLIWKEQRDKAWSKQQTYLFDKDHEKFCLMIDMNDIYGSHVKVGYVDVGNGAG
jgi:hypothetical protein